MADVTARPEHNRGVGRGGASEGAFLFDPPQGTVTSEMGRLEIEKTLDLKQY